MINFDSHIHTELCGHAHGMTVPLLLAQADKLNLDCIAITEHIYKQTDIKFIPQLKEEVQSTPHKCNVIVGIELDADTSKTNGTLMADNNSIKDIDLVMAAIHYLPNHSHYPHGPEDLPYPPETLLEYWHTTLIGLTSNPAVDILAHPARLPGMVLDLNIFFDDILNILTEAAKLSAQNNIVWEINDLTCARIPAEWVSQWHKTIQIAIDQNVKITFGSDAHSPDEIARQNYAQQILKDLKNLDKLYTPLEIIDEK